ncbi:MAG: hypothetical protein HY288_00955 [Planctomycetia bacterium]|nr:hypothetical protein [Planctomycetia bacterium]
MQRCLRGPIAILTLGFTVFLAGCSNSKLEQSSKPEPAADKALRQTAGDETADALAQLDPADRDAAKQQAVCPVSDEKLGSMGAPFKVSAEGKDVLLCCEGCREDFQKDPQKFLAKLKK